MEALVKFTQNQDSYFYRIFTHFSDTFGNGERKQIFSRAAFLGPSQIDWGKKMWDSWKKIEALCLLLTAPCGVYDYDWANTVWGYHTAHQKDTEQIGWRWKCWGTLGTFKSWESKVFVSFSFPEYIEAASCAHPREGWSQNQKLWIAGLPSSLTEPIK